jgi:hypothetical protein
VYWVLCCVVLCCVVMRCVVLCCVVLCCVVLVGWWVLVFLMTSGDKNEEGGVMKTNDSDVSNSVIIAVVTRV